MYMDSAVHQLKRLAPLAFLVLAACEDPFGPSFWNATPDTLQIYSASRAEYVGFVSAVDLANQPVTPVPLESPAVTGNWDFALTDGPNGLELAPASAFEGMDSRARIAELLNEDFDALEQAPRDTALYSAAPVRLRADAVYVVRTRRASCGLSSGYRYAKLKPLAIDQAAGTFRFAVVRNPFCDDRSFVPPEE